MLSRSASAAFRSTVKTNASVVRSCKVILSQRFNSSSTQDETVKKSKRGKKASKPFYDVYSQFVSSNKINEDGMFIHEQPTEADFENSALAAHLKKVNQEKEASIEERLKALAESNNVPFEELVEKFNAKVEEKELIIQSEHDAIINKVNSFTKMLSTLPSTGVSGIISEMLNSLLPLADTISESEAFKYVYKIDPKFATSFSNLIRTNPTQELVDTLVSDFQNGPISRISNKQYDELKSLLSESESSTETLEAIESRPIDGQSVLETIFSNLNNYENINNSPLLKLIETIDNEFATLLKSYEVIDPSNGEELNAKYQEILDYCSNRESKIFQSFEDSSSENFQILKRVLEQPLPIDLSELYEVFEFYPDYFTSSLFKKIQEVDPKFGELLVELETLPEGEALDKKNDEIDAYLSNDNTPIYIAMNDINSESYKNLRSSLDAEWKIIESTVTPDKLVEYLIHNGLESDGFKLIERIDPTFTEIVSKLYNEQNEEESMKLYGQLQDYLSEPNAIADALSDKESINYKLLSDYVFQEAKEEIEAAEEIEEAVESVQNESSVNSIADQLAELKNEDQSKLPEDVAKMNEAYDLTIEIIDELENEIKTNTFIAPSRKISESMDKLLGFQPDAQQVKSAQALKGKALPKQTDEVLELAVNIIMKDGKKETARKHLNRALYLLFLETRENPVNKLKEALDLVAPIVVTKTVKTGFAKNFTVPVPLTQRQRNRMALLWILKSSDSKASNDFSVRLCDEILHVLSGKSSLMDKRVLSHKLAIANRSYLSI